MVRLFSIDKFTGLFRGPSTDYFLPTIWLQWQYLFCLVAHMIGFLSIESPVIGCFATSGEIYPVYNQHLQAREASEVFVFFWLVQRRYCGFFHRQFAAVD